MDIYTQIFLTIIGLFFLVVALSIAVAILYYEKKDWEEMYVKAQNEADMYKLQRDSLQEIIEEKGVVCTN